MTPPLDAYMVRMRNLHNRYCLPLSVMTLFGALGEQQRGYDPDALGRLMRMSPGMRKACTDTISQLAMVMQKNQDPSTIAECTELIKSCTEMLALANESVADKRFPLLKLPIEIRRRVYHQYFHGLLYFPTRTIIPLKCSVRCECPPLERRASRRYNIELAFTSQAVKDEVLAAFIETHTFHFGCGCELKAHLSNNDSLRDHLKSLKIHWTGPRADAAFKMLKQVSNLKRLIIVVSRSTTNHLSRREEALQEFFIQRKNAPTRLTDALGFDELLELSGLNDVKVEHISKTQGFLRTGEERYSLERYLEYKIKV